jgi:hypothetical protein
MQQVHAYARITHGYADGWRHLDQDEFVATVKLTPAKVAEAQKVPPEFSLLSAIIQDFLG